MAKTTNSSALSVQVFGEATSLPITIKKAIFQSTPTLPFVNLAIVNVELHLLNKVVSKDDATGKLKLSLPIGASVKKFEVATGDTWYPATAVPKKKATQVVYLEKEKGRSVAAVSTTTASSNVFEIEISPLPYQQVSRCRLEILTNQQHELVESCTFNPGTFKTNNDDESTTVSKEILPSLFITNGSSIASLPENQGAAALVGESFGKTHFLCKIPPMVVPPSEISTTQNSLGRIVIFWDSSASIGLNDDDIVVNRCNRLQELLEQGKTRTVELYSLGMDEPLKLGVFSTKEDGDINVLLEAIRSICYDGGTDLTLFPKTILNLANTDFMDIDEDHNEEYAIGSLDAVLVFTDGVDNLGRIPAFVDSTRITFPVHCIADTDEINLHCLRSIAAASPFVPGTVLTKNNESYLQGILYPQPILYRVETDQDEDAFVEERDDDFRCVPDHRLKVLNETIPNSGMWISGILGDSVSTLTATVKFGNTDQKFHFQLRDDKMEDTVNGTKTKKAFCEYSPTLTFKTNQNNLAARILGHVYAEETYKTAEAYGLKSGTSTKQVMEELSVSYGFCTPESSLLMLYTKDQFTEHGIRPPDGHPVATEIQDQAVSLSKHKNGPASGEIGGRKNESQKVVVTRLAQNLKGFFEKDSIHPHGVAMINRSRGGDVYGGGGGGYGGGRGRDCDRGGGGFVGGCSGGEGGYSDRGGGGDDRYATHRQSGGIRFNGAERGHVTSPVCMFKSSAYTPASPCYGPVSPIYTPTSPYYEPASSGYRPASSGFGSASPRNVPASPCYGPASPASSDTKDNRKAVLAPKDPKHYIEALELSLKENTGVHWRNVYTEELKSAGGYASASPSLFLNTARCLISNEKPTDAIRIAANCLERGYDDVQMLRSVGYVLLSAETNYSKHLAKDLFDHIKELAPLEPQSFLDASLVRFWMCMEQFPLVEAIGETNDRLLSNLTRNFMEAQAGLVHVVTHSWASRFNEVEWPALVLLHYLADYAKENNKSIFPVNLLSWPQALDDFQVDLQCSLFAPSLMVWLGWDTDKTDLDLHVLEPSNTEIYYRNNRGRGSHLSRDFTQGYGPEIYIAKQGIAEKGTYKIYAKYYSSHQDSKLTGTTSAVVWAIAVDEKGQKKIKFSFVRLNTQKQKNHVASATIV